MSLYQLGDTAPSIDADAYVAAEATVIGNVTLKARASVWPGAVIRGDNEPIVVGEATNVQEGAVLNGRIDMAGGAAGAAKSPTASKPSEASGGEVRKSA